MTETPGATDVMNAPLASLSPSQAGERRAALAADPQFQSRVAARDSEAFAENYRLWRIEHGMPLEPIAPVNATDVLTETIGRQLQEAQTRADGMRNDGFNAVQIYEYLNGRPVPLAERQDAERRLANIKRDKAFQQRLADGDPEARYEYSRVHKELTLPVGTLEQINAWEAAHAGRKPK